MEEGERCDRGVEGERGVIGRGGEEWSQTGNGKEGVRRGGEEEKGKMAL